MLCNSILKLCYVTLPSNCVVRHYFSNYFLTLLWNGIGYIRWINNATWLQWTCLPTSQPYKSVLFNEKRLLDLFDLHNNLWSFFSNNLHIHRKYLNFQMKKKISKLPNKRKSWVQYQYLMLFSMTRNCNFVVKDQSGHTFKFWAQ